MKEKDNRRWYMKEKYSVPWLWGGRRYGKVYFTACMVIAHFLRKLDKGEDTNESE